MDRPIRSTWVLGLLLAAVIAAALRLPRLSDRPMHTDEAVHAVKLFELWNSGRYVYDPREFHGPTLYYFTVPMLRLAGVQSFADFDERHLRLAPALFGVGMILLLGLLRDGLGRAATVLSGLVLALSSAFVFYSRYYIQETPLAFFTLAAIGAGWRYVCRPSAGWAILTGLAVGLMHATKETAIIAWGCALPATALVAWRSAAARDDGTRSTRGAPVTPAPRRRYVAHAIAGALTAAVVSALLFSVCFTQARGPLDSIRAYRTYLERAGGGSVHVHPPWFYLRILAFVQDGSGPWWSEASILALAVVGVVFAWRATPAGRAALPRFLAIYALLMLAAYSLIPYKTPWCLLQFYLPLALLAGCGAAGLLRGDRWRRGTVALLLLAGGAHLLSQSRSATTRFAADQRNPYVYGHSLRAVVDLGDWVNRLAAVAPEGRQMLVRVFADDPWPLPWYLRRLERVGYWPAGATPDAYDAPVVIVDETLVEHVRSRLRAAYQETTYGVRPGLKMRVLVQSDLYHQFAMSQAQASRAQTPPASRPRADRSPSTP